MPQAVPTKVFVTELGHDLVPVRRIAQDNRMNGGPCGGSDVRHLRIEEASTPSDAANSSVEFHGPLRRSVCVVLMKSSPSFDDHAVVCSCLAGWRCARARSAAATAS